MGVPVVIDGYVKWRAPDGGAPAPATSEARSILLYTRGDEPSAASRARLLHDLIRWADRRQRRVVLVGDRAPRAAGPQPRDARRRACFDAWAQGQRVEREERHGPVTVCFTRYGERADEWIVRWITTRPEAVVVTSDRAVGQAARRRAAAVIGAAAFAARLDGTAIADDPDTAADADAVPDRREPRPRRRLGRRANWLRGL